MNQNIIRAITDRKKPHVQLVGLDGNAFFILARTREAMRSCGWSKAEIAEFTDEAISGDYDALIRTVMEYCECD